jgi:exosortase/archaeosortase family protein
MDPMTNHKQTFKMIFLALAIILMLLPIVAALNSFLTESLNKANWYQPIQKYVVPWEAKLVSAAVYMLGIETRVAVGPARFAFYMVKEDSILPVDLAWNCLGWQSMLLLIISLVAGLRGRFTNISRLECIVLGLFGTLLMNIFRMSLIAAGIYYINEVFAMVVHDYLAAFLAVVWMLVFWWFSYSYILEAKDDVVQEKAIKV